MKLKICFVANGQSIHTQKWVSYFAKRGHDVHLVTFDRTDPIEGVAVHNLGYHSKLAYPFRISDVKKAVKMVAPDVLHAHFVSHYGVYAALTGFRPFVLTAWGSDVLIEPKRSMIKRYFVKYALKKADVITCDAEHVKEAMARLGIEPEEISLIRFGIDTQKFRPGERSEELLTKLGLDGSPAVISLRNLEPLYDVESLVRAVPLVLKEAPETKFVVVGRGSDENRLKNLAESLRVSGNIKFMGFISNDELPRYLIAMDVYVSTSLSDAGIAASTAEAMACGLPAIVTDVADNRRWVKDGENGFVVQVKDPQALAQRIICLLKNVDMRKQFGKANRKVIEENNDYYKEMAKMEDIYQELAKRRKQ
jgi:glycosyltransferase involved in cell wall biosynthesis